MLNRRQFLATAAAAGTITVLSFAVARAAGHSGDVFPTDNGQITIHPISHASFVMETPGGVIYNDPVGEASAYEGLPAPDLILISHEHGDHYNADTLAALAVGDTRMIVNPAVYAMLPDEMKERATEIGNGQSASYGDITVEAIPAYNITEDRLQFHPEGRDNGYILTIDGMRVYIAGDTEGTPEMRALSDIDLAFVPMNLPYTMDVTQAADAVAEFAPTYVYPYHFRDSDPAQFAALVADSGATTEVRMGSWYGHSS